MKSVIFAVLAMGTQAFAYNSTYVPIQYGQHTIVEMKTSQLMYAKVISLKLEVNSKTGSLPLVQIAAQDQKNCSHKQTLIMYSGFDLVTKTYKRTYEIQIERDLSKICYVAIFNSTSTQDKTNAARVSILPR